MPSGVTITFFWRPLKIQISRGIPLAQIAGAKPAVLADALAPTGRPRQ